MKPKFLFALLAGLASIALLFTACGDDDDDGGDDNGGSEPAAQVGDLDIMAPYSRGTLERGAVFFTVVNNGTEDDALIAAAADIAGSAEIHETVMNDSQAMMQPVEKIDVPAGGEVTLEPGGLHVMLLDLPEPLEVGQTFPVELTFEKAGTVELTVEVQSYSD